MKHTLLFPIFFAIYLVITIIFGVKKARAQDQGTVKDWFVAGGKMHWTAVGFTIAAAWLDVATIFLNAGQGYHVGVSAFWYLAGAEMIAFVLAGIFLAKKVRKSGYISQGEMIDVRYGDGIRPWVSLIWVIALCGYAALSFLVFHEFLFYLYGVSQYVSALICFAIVLIFQLVGGFASTVYADYIQGALILVASILLGVMGVDKAGGLSNVMSTVPPSFLSFFGMGVDKILTISIPLILAFTVEPTLWMRLVSARSTKDARKGSFLAVLIYIPVCIGTLLCGLAAFVIFPNWGDSHSVDMIAVEMANTVFPPVITTIVFVGIIAALISSFNAFMSAANMNLCYDFIPALYKQIKKKPFPEDKYRLVSRYGMVGIAFISTFVALWLPTLVKILEFSGSLVASAIFLPVMGVFFSKKITRLGAIMSAGVGAASQLAFFIFGAPFGVNPFFLSFPLALIALIVGTLIGKKKPTEQQLTPFFDITRK